MSVKDRKSFSDQLSIINLYDLERIADEELNKIGEEATSEVDFKNKYEKYLSKYKGKLIRNPYDSEDLTLYVPDGNNVQSYLANTPKKIVIGNSVKTIKLDNDLSDTEKLLYSELPVPKSSIYPVDYAGKVIKGKKKTAYAVRTSPVRLIKVSVGCQKKMWYGWKRDSNRDIYYRLITYSPLTFFVHPYYPDAPALTTNFVNIYCYPNQGQIDEITGLLTESGFFHGRLMVWTDNTIIPDQVVPYALSYNDSDRSFGIQQFGKLLDEEAYGGEFRIVCFSN